MVQLLQWIFRGSKLTDSKAWHLYKSHGREDIKVDTHTHTIQTQNDLAYIYEETRKCLITIPIDRLK